MLMTGQRIADYNWLFSESEVGWGLTLTFYLSNQKPALLSYCFCRSSLKNNRNISTTECIIICQLYPNEKWGEVVIKTFKLSDLKIWGFKGPNDNVWASLLKFLPPRPDSRKVVENGWFCGFVSSLSSLMPKMMDCFSLKNLLSIFWQSCESFYTVNLRRADPACFCLMAKSPGDAHQAPVAPCRLEWGQTGDSAATSLLSFHPIAPCCTLAQASQNAPPQFGRLTPGVGTCQSRLQLAVQLLDRGWEMWGRPQRGVPALPMASSLCIHGG